LPLWAYTKIQILDRQRNTFFALALPVGDDYIDSVFGLKKDSSEWHLCVVIMILPILIVRGRGAFFG
jgi:hypothetical protein